MSRDGLTSAVDPATELHLRWLLTYADGYDRGQVTAHEVWVASWWHDAALERARRREAREARAEGRNP